MDAPDYVLEGERVALGPLRKDLADRYRRWVHDLDVRSGILTVGVYALDAEEAWVEETIAKCAGAAPSRWWASAATSAHGRGGGRVRQPGAGGPPLS